MKIKETLTQAEIAELRNLLVDWEDGNISDCEYCNKAGKILGLGGWTGKGKEGKVYPNLFILPIT